MSADSSEPTPATIDKASTLLEFLWANITSLFSQSFCASLAEYPIAPVLLPGTDGGMSHAVQLGLSRFKDAALPRDCHLTWSVLPVLAKGSVPPEMCWGPLGVKTSPGFRTVLEHLKRLTATGRLDRWDFSDPVVEVFQSVYDYLNRHWGDLSPTQIGMLRDMPIVPIGDRFVLASRLYFKLSENLAPFMFEIPRSFGAYDELFKHLGAKTAPQTVDYTKVTLATEGMRWDGLGDFHGSVGVDGGGYMHARGLYLCTRLRCVAVAPPGPQLSARWGSAKPLRAQWPVAAGTAGREAVRPKGLAAAG